jgi:hypothetical protein
MKVGMGGVERNAERARLSSANVKWRKHLEYVDVDGMIILILIFEEVA